MAGDRFEDGLAVRREVLGAEHVDRALERATDFDRPLQDLVTRYCWGEVWTRPGLDRRTRSLLNLAMLTALNRPKELAGHVRGALTNGCTPGEISEVILQARDLLRRAGGDRLVAGRSRGARGSSGAIE